MIVGSVGKEGLETTYSNFG